MTGWTAQQLAAFKTADDFHVSPYYTDGKTYGTPTWIWSVVVADQLYIRAWNGQRSRWYQAAIRQQAGKISLAGQDYQVQFAAAADDAALNQQIDAAYQAKYQGSPYLPPMLAAGPVSATVRVTPVQDK
ncbi:DUF2255 family protein [Pediococcus ethanolidurans]|uniref:DUF2255 family protein n=1 Tax=Pediococcus ethanolidurans TaxID=319653 RepID=A0A0R2JZX8_9LACO|nr:DUF2255 family protein [Pediococcus ethanolidurans]KRN82787.1 hypothetical protein IV87_GL001964 [Pediococcus ethanolidurans]GEN94791.1 hypothetical protein PET01_08410 [Pediococcus ethanolidurans]SER42033.1 hypothetical protein SAMN04487973_10674 [Pediococcus ethanolidurans]